MTVAYLPELGKNNPIVRDFDCTAIRYRTMDGEEKNYRDNIPLDGKVFAPTLPIQYGEDESFFVIDVYRPTLVKEVLLDGSIIQYLKKDETLDLPYIYKDRTQVNDFSCRGYQAYQCNNIGNIYTEDFINISGNPSIGEAAMNAWRMDRRFMGNLLDAVAQTVLWYVSVIHKPTVPGMEKMLCSGIMMSIQTLSPLIQIMKQTQKM